MIPKVDTYDLAGARRAAAEDRLLPWLVALLSREPGANRNLAAILKGHEPILEGPIRVPLAELTQEAGPGAGFRWPKEATEWEAQVAPLLALEAEALPPVLFRETAGERCLSDGSHRLDAWRRRGETHGWAIRWRDRAPWTEGWWSPFPPDRAPKIAVEGAIVVARVGTRVVGELRLEPCADGLTLATLGVDPEWRGRRLGARLLHHARPLMEGRAVRCLAPAGLARLLGEFGFRLVEPLPEGNVALRREPEHRHNGLK